VSAKDLVLRPITSAVANGLIRRVHYSGTVGHAPQLNVGVCLHGRLEGAIQFGLPVDKRRSSGIVRGTEWHNFMELNRLAFTEALPRNSESRALSVSFRLLRKHAPQIKWIVSYADATACGDGAIYRASGFVLTGIRRNTTILVFPDGERVADVLLHNPRVARRAALARRWGVKVGGGASVQPFLDAGAVRAPGYQFRYIRFLDPSWRSRLTVPEIPFDQIPPECRMIRGVRQLAGGAGNPPAKGGASPTLPLHASEAD